MTVRTPEEIAQRIAERQQNRTPPKTSKMFAQEIIDKLKIGGKLTQEPDGRILINGNTVFFTHFRHEETPDFFVERNPEGFLTKDGFALTMAYYFDGDDVVKAAVTVKSPTDNYNRRVGNAYALERLVLEDVKYYLQIPAQEVSGEVSMSYNAATRMNEVLQLFAPQDRETLLDSMQGAIANTPAKSLSHYAVQDVLIRRFISEMQFVGYAFDIDVDLLNIIANELGFEQF